MQENKVIYFENNKPDGTGSFKAIPAYHTFFQLGRSGVFAYLNKHPEHYTVRHEH